ncbi:MAG: hypothetical protein JWO05_3806 [Gemmatimonadetes bacterium]|nr:hypothetical protein [Gemmatimonadota bacterium]
MTRPRMTRPRTLAALALMFATATARAQHVSSQASDPNRSPLSFSVGSARTVARQSAVHLLVDFTKDLSGVDWQQDFRRSLVYFTPDIKLETGSADAFEGITAKLTGNAMFFHTTTVDGLVTPDLSFFHAFPISLGAESDGRFQRVNGIAEVGYVPWFQGSVPLRLRTLSIGAFVQGGYKWKAGTPDSIGTTGGKRDESREPLDAGVLRAKASARWSIATRRTKSGLGLGFHATGDAWFDLLHSATYHRVTGIMRFVLDEHRYFDFAWEKGSGAPNFNTGRQVRASLAFLL